METFLMKALTKISNWSMFLGPVEYEFDILWSNLMFFIKKSVPYVPRKAMILLIWLRGESQHLRVQSVSSTPTNTHIE